MIIFFILSTTQLSAMNLYTRYKRLSTLQNSAITRKCLLCETHWFKWLIWSNQNITKECDFLEKKLEDIATTGGNRTTGNGYWAWIEAMAQDKAQKRISQTVQTILSDEPETVRKEEEVKLSTLAYQLADDYDLRQTAKKEQKSKILEQLKVEELRMDEQEKKIADLGQHETLRYPHIKAMFDGHVKQTCLDCKPGLLIRNSTEKMCDTFERRLHETATQGCIESESNFFHTATFENKEKEHEITIKKILPNLFDAVRYEELIKLNAYAKRLEKKYRIQEDSKRIKQLEASMKQYKDEKSQ
jgi:hypothetical protein